MKIGIFGDSFATNNPNNSTASWVDLLSNIHDVKNFALPGSSLYYSADQFLKKHYYFDKVIFVVTDSGRLCLPNYNIDGFNRHIAGLSNAESLLLDLKNDTDLPKIKILKAAVDYFSYLQNLDYNEYVHNLIINDILSKRTDVILIPTTRHHGNFYKGKSVMQDISLKELDSWSTNINRTSIIDRRHAHMSEENNEIFLKNVLQWLSGVPVNIDIDDYVQPKYLDFYLESRI